MPGYQRRADRERQRLRGLLSAFGHDVQQARTGAGLSQRRVAAAVGIAQSRLSAIERGVAASPSLEALAQIAGVVGLELSLRVFPAGSPLRDAGHAALFGRLRATTSPILRWRSEVPLPITGDRRSWDAVAFDASGAMVMAVELDTRTRDAQALARKLALKKRDGGVE